MSNRVIVKEIASKNDDGTVSDYLGIGSDFNSVIDTRVGQEGYTLAQFFDNYMEFMRSGHFIYCGPNTPTNTHIKLWVDTNSTNI